MSGGRVELGIGAGWYEREHTSLGIPFPPVAERFDRLAEQIDIVTGMWRTPIGRTFTYRGRYHNLVEAPGLPKPKQPDGPPIIIGGRGRRRTPQLAVRYAHEFNAAFQTVGDADQQFKRVRELPEHIERAASSRPQLRLSVGVVVACGKSDAEARRRAAVLHETNSALPPEDPVVGPPAKLVDRIEQLDEIGADRVYLRLTDLADLDHLELIASHVLPHVS
jgi:alkanesulfonate monooxygenase SsuD/methylene tetrahydromethanopterin reductase-like flavin-dependent oxidoreductase (luciferase family)